LWASKKHDAHRYGAYNMMLYLGPAAAGVIFYDYIIFTQKKPLKYSFRGLGLTKLKKIIKA
jgi:hypothetical protein